VRRSLSAEQIVAAALELTRDVGLEGLTMAVLAQRLGVGAMTLYSYFSSRDELLDAMARRAAVELYDQHVDLDGASWDVELQAHYRAIRASLKRHPTLADLLFYRGQVLVAANAEHDDTIAAHIRRHVQAMIQGGIEPGLAVRSFFGLSMFTLASALRPEDLATSTTYRGQLEQVLQSAGYSTGTDDARFGSDDEFEVMLELLLRGLRSTTSRDT
jgi:AcrR family transcriptional regulator